jgi:hypothetical protein
MSTIRVDSFLLLKKSSPNLPLRRQGYTVRAPRLYILYDLKDGNHDDDDDDEAALVPVSPSIDFSGGVTAMSWAVLLPTKYCPPADATYYHTHYRGYFNSEKKKKTIIIYFEVVVTAAHDGYE